MKTIDPLTVQYAAQDSREEVRRQQFPIMSTSKSFCGAVCSLMALDGKFGENGINATLQEVLMVAQKPELGEERSAKIANYLAMLQDKGLQDVRMSDLLSHRSGVDDILLSYDRERDYADKFNFFSDKIKKRDPDVPYATSGFKYSNTGYELLEEMVNFASDQGGYLSELRQRVLQPLGISATTTALVSSPEALGRVGTVHIPPERRAPFDKEGESSSDFRSYSPLELHQGRQGSLAAGALCSTIEDMEIYSAELAKMISGQPSKLTAGKTPQEIQDVHQFYKDSRGDNGYSLGVAIVDNKGQCVIQKGGRFPGNKSDMAITMPFSFDDFMQDKTDVLQTEDSRSHVYMQQRCFVVDDLNEKYQDALRGYFSEVDPAIANEFVRINDKGNPENNEWRKSLNQWRDRLIENEKLAPDFKESQEEICQKLGKACKEIYNYLDDSKADHSKDAIDAFKNEKLTESLGGASKGAEAVGKFTDRVAKACGVDLEEKPMVSQKAEIKGEALGPHAAAVKARSSQGMSVGHA